MAVFTAKGLQKLASGRNLVLPPHVASQLVAAIDSGKHVILTGPPGTGKTTLAHLAAELGQSTLMCTGFLPTTATSDWTTYETIGGMQPCPDGLVFRAGIFVEAIESGRWLVIDEMNRSNFDRAFGQLFTVLSGGAVVLPFTRGGHQRRLSLVPHDVEVPAGTDPIRVPATWRIIGTINAVDKNLLFDMSYALMRRFAFIEVASPVEAAYDEILSTSSRLVRTLLPLRRFCDLGPAIYLDAGRYAERRVRDDVSDSRVIYEMFYAYFLPQLESIDDSAVPDLVGFMADLLDSEEHESLQRSMSAVLGSELVGQFV